MDSGVVMVCSSLVLFVLIRVDNHQPVYALARHPVAVNHEIQVARVVVEYAPDRVAANGVSQVTALKPRHGRDILG
jgi:hypothetical protein